VIKQIAFKHGWWYFYRLHKQKTDTLTKNFPTLKNFLYTLFTDCPHNYFNVEPRSSKLRFSLNNIKLNHIKNHELTEATKIGLLQNAERYESNHSKVQLFMLEQDTNTIAIEVPLWLIPEELKNYEEFFQTRNPLTGHIDALRIEGDKIWIWDYKPNAKQEKFAATQVFFYAYMLSKRTNLPLEHFRCGYFDSLNTYVFNPTQCTLPRTKQATLHTIQKPF